MRPTSRAPRRARIARVARAATAAAALTILPAAAAAQAGQAVLRHVPASAPRTADAAVQPGDVVRITVWRKPELSGDFRIAEDSAIAHPLYRTVRIVGLSLPAAREQIAAFLRGFDADPQFVVEPLLRVTVRGEVVRSNVYSLAPSTTLAQALALAGGPSDRGRRDRVLLVRGQSATPVLLTGASASGLVRSGDELVVERQRSVFREVVTPTFTIVGALAGVVSIILRSTR
jgi:protein involved in polysaccharide export with SLBB domain